ncbi:helix-turn-helix domain-containing protein [Rhizobium lusitanum]|uniref:Helix-turn-helix domain-containing protein n=1 Tax=Rhizobium lusitanum TaxID=293958 RepID=A0A6L9UDU6_9HYPH|nr:AraC family transcriptional regulator [Rhizobium lusitanum]NEI72788.1 helix-turn-helix domain-containing protein [Rhizobium lusitanum]
MAASTSYGKAFGKRLGARSSGYASRALSKAMLAVTELRYDDPQHVLSTPPVEEDAFVVALHLKFFPRYRYWENDRPARESSLLPGQIIIYDIKRKPIFHLNDSFHSVHYYFPRAALDAVAEEAGVPSVTDLHYNPGVCMDDPVVRDLTFTLLPLFADPQNVPRLFMDSVLVGVAHHVACRYGGMRVRPVTAASGLTRWQQVRAKELISANLDGNLPLAALAAECGMSMRQFLKAFKLSVGATPHQWLLRRRIELAQMLLRDPDLPIPAVASSCGFSDQSHLTRVFTAKVGMTPAVWRRECRK